MAADTTSRAPASTEGTTRFRRSADAVTRDVAGETLLVPIRGHLADLQRIYALNPVGALVWSRLDGIADVQGLCRAVAMDFEVEASEAETSVREFLDQLVEAGLAEPVAHPLPREDMGAEAIGGPR